MMFQSLFINITAELFQIKGNLFSDVEKTHRRALPSVCDRVIVLNLITFKI